MTSMSIRTSAEPNVHAAATTRAGRRLRWRHLWLVPGLALAIYANQLGNANGVGILALVAFGIAPDVPRLFGSRAVAMHNVLHQPMLPIMAAAVAASLAITGVAPVIGLVATLVWLSHVIVGRAVGDTPRVARSRSDA